MHGIKNAITNRDFIVTNEIIMTAKLKKCKSLLGEEKKPCFKTNIYVLFKKKSVAQKYLIRKTFFSMLMHYL